jgi:hypothetical protein
MSNEKPCYPQSTDQTAVQSSTPAYCRGAAALTLPALLQIERLVFGVGHLKG